MLREKIIYWCVVLINANVYSWDLFHAQFSSSFILYVILHFSYIVQYCCFASILFLHCMYMVTWQCLNYERRPFGAWWRGVSGVQGRALLSTIVVAPCRKHSVTRLQTVSSHTPKSLILCCKQSCFVLLIVLDHAPIMLQSCIMWLFFFMLQIGSNRASCDYLFMLQIGSNSAPCDYFFHAPNRLQSCSMWLFFSCSK